jgi:hypothetical protein
VKELNQTLSCLSHLDRVTVPRLFFDANIAELFSIGVSLVK